MLCDTKYCSPSLLSHYYAVVTHIFPLSIFVITYVLEQKQVIQSFNYYCCMILRWGSVLLFEYLVLGASLVRPLFKCLWQIHSSSTVVVLWVVPQLSLLGSELPDSLCQNFETLQQTSWDAEKVSNLYHSKTTGLKFELFTPSDGYKVTKTSYTKISWQLNWHELQNLAFEKGVRQRVGSVFVNSAVNLRNKTFSACLMAVTF